MFSEAVGYLIVFCLGLIFGSFLNAWVYRTKHRLSVVWARSWCVHCHARLTWYENIPVFSFIFLRGECRHCQKPISLQYPLVELITGFLFLFAYWYHGADLSFRLVRDWYVLLVLFFIFLYDLKDQVIPDRVTLPAIIILFILSLIFGWESTSSMLLGAAIGGGFFLFQYVVSKGAWIGGGDIRLGVLMGVILAWPVTILALFLAYLGGAVISLVLLGLRRATLKTAVPFGIYLTVATVICLFYGNKIIMWYIKLTGF